MDGFDSPFDTATTLGRFGLPILFGTPAAAVAVAARVRRVARSAWLRAVRIHESCSRLGVPGTPSLASVYQAHCALHLETLCVVAYQAQ